MDWWPPEVHAREQQLFHGEFKDTWIFRNRADGIYFAVGDVDPIGIQTILMVADIVKYTNQRIRGTKFDGKWRYYR